ncbi:MAG: DUF2812 domain-containing protein [Ruminococcaceae bacterium]|nr:DUF2812 domain-containing protein [Oscillospiraceae bacterium]
MATVMTALHKDLPYELFEIDANEDWLDEQARQGLRLTGIRGRRCWFEKPDAPAMTRYRIDVLGRRRDDLERRAAYRELGWEYVDSIDSRLDVYRAARPDAVELNTDEDALRHALRRYRRQQYLLLVVDGIFVLLFLWILLSHSFRLLLSGNPYAWAVSLGYLVYVIISLGHELHILLQVRRRRLTERGYHSPAAARRRGVLRWGLWLLMMAILLTRLIGGYRAPLAIRDSIGDLPVDGIPLPTAAELFGPEAPQRTAIFRADFPLCTYYCSDRYDGRYDPVADTCYYGAELRDVRWPFLAAGYARELRRGTGAQGVAVPGWEQAWYYETPGGDRGKSHLILLDGCRVMTVDCTGASLPENLALFAQSL